MAINIMDFSLFFFLKKNASIKFSIVSHASILRLDSLNAEAMSFDEDGNEVWYFILLLTFEWDAYISLSYLLYYFLAPWMISELSILCIQSIDVKVQKALDCPCVAELKNGPCGSQFVDAFSCFLKSTEEEKVLFLSPWHRAACNLQCKNDSCTSPW